MRAEGDLDGDEIERRFAELEGQAGAALDADGFTSSDRTVQRLADVRYAGQVKALTLPVDAARSLAAQWPEVRARFLEEYERRFQYVTEEIGARGLGAARAGPRPRPGAGASRASSVPRASRRCASGGRCGSTARRTTPPCSRATTSAPATA